MLTQGRTSIEEQTLSMVLICAFVENLFIVNVLRFQVAEVKHNVCLIVQKSLRVLSPDTDD